MHTESVAFGFMQMQLLEMVGEIVPYAKREPESFTR